MATTTVEEASHCPRCGEAGEELRRMRKLRERYNNVIILRCNNERWSFFETNWIVQADDDGNVPVRDANPEQDKQFRKVSEAELRMGEREIAGLAKSNSLELPPM